MKAYRSLSRRIVFAFVLMAAVISALFSAGIIVVVQFVEKQLVSNTLNSDLTLAMADFNAGRDISLQPGSRFYYDNPNSDDVLNTPPDWLNHMASGFHEVKRDDHAYHLLVYQQGKESFLLLRESDFDKRERALFVIISAGFLLSVIAAWILGYFLSRRIIEPVVRLAGQVSYHEQLQDFAPPLAPGYADDEVGQLAAAFDNTLDQLRKALERERFFTSDVSHEFRTPLTVIATSSELLLAADTLTNKQRDQLMRIRRACDEMRDLVHTFLLLARDNLSQETSTDKATLASVAEEQFLRWKPLAEEKGLSMDFVQESQGAAVYDVPFLRAVLSNLLRNAVHYTDSGFVRLVINGDSLRVEDTGHGIDAEQQEAIFRPFVRGKGARGEGLGLGLSLVKRICAHQGWKIQLTSRQPQGSCFRVELNPLSET